MYLKRRRNENILRMYMGIVVVLVRSFKLLIVTTVSSPGWKDSIPSYGCWKIRIQPAIARGRWCDQRRLRRHLSSFATRTRAPRAPQHQHQHQAAATRSTPLCWCVSDACAVFVLKLIQLRQIVRNKRTRARGKVNKINNYSARATLARAWSLKNNCRLFAEGRRRSAADPFG